MAIPVFLCCCCALNQVVTVNRARGCCLGQARGYELQYCHLSCGILHGNPIYTGQAPVTEAQPGVSRQEQLTDTEAQPGVSRQEHLTENGLLQKYLVSTSDS